MLGQFRAAAHFSKMIHSGKKSISLSSDELGVLSVSSYKETLWGGVEGVFSFTHGCVCAHTHAYTHTHTHTLTHRHMGCAHTHSHAHAHCTNTHTRGHRHEDMVARACAAQRSHKHSQRRAAVTAELGHAHKSPKHRHTDKHALLFFSLLKVTGGKTTLMEVTQDQSDQFADV